MVATLQALVAELQLTAAEQRATIFRLEELVRDLETRVRTHSGNLSQPLSSDMPSTPKRTPSRSSSRAWAATKSCPGQGGEAMAARHWSEQQVTVHWGRVQGRFRGTLW